MNPKKPKPAPAGNPLPSRRDQLNARRLSFAADTEAAVAVQAILGLIVAAVVGTWLVFLFGGMIESQAAAQATSCSTWYTGDAPGIAACKERAATKVLVWNIGSILMILGAIGLGGISIAKTGQGGASVAFGVIVSGAIGTWMVFMLGGMIESSGATQKANCATWYTGDAPAIAACEERQENKLAIWNIGSFLLVLAACGGGAIGGHFGGKALKNRWSGRRRGQSPRRGRWRPV